ncbi:MAG: hypothetical protein HC765_10645, partial [Brachymonas sp.]|nr:hypothetical protein [Brachymonas sp.]
AGCPAGITNAAAVTATVAFTQPVGGVTGHGHGQRQQRHHTGQQQQRGLRGADHSS